MYYSLFRFLKFRSASPASARPPIILVHTPGEEPGLWRERIAADLQFLAGARLPADSLRLVAGGDRRQDSVRAGLEALGDTSGGVLIHDSARPFFTDQDLESLLAATPKNGGASLSRPVTDTLVDTHALTYPDRGRLRSIQTPQSVGPGAGGALLELYQKGDREYTDETSALVALGRKVEFVTGNPHNEKITFGADLSRMEQRAAEFTRENPLVENFHQTPVPAAPVRIGLGQDSHAFGGPAEKPLVVGGCELDGGGLSFQSHSDGDLLYHALTDALLGAIGHPEDIGGLFPDNREENRDRASADFVTAAMELVRRAGYRVGNLDAVIISQKVKIAPARGQMRGNIACLLDCRVDQVSLKGKTAEKMGALGRSEGMACTVTVLLVSVD